MLAATYSHRGSSDVLQVRDVPTPGPSSGEVRVRLHVAGVNPTDWKMRQTGPDLPYPFQVPGMDGAGVIEAVGPGVDPSRIGERVWVYHAGYQRQWGTAAQYTVVPSRQAVRLPDGIDWGQAAGLGIPYITAYGCLVTDGPVDGRSVLVAGGAGAVGHAAIELAVRQGAHVIATVSSSAKAEIAAAAGAHVVINYREPDAIERIRAAARAGVDRIIEVALTANLGMDLEVIAPHGTIVTYAAEPADPTIPVRPLMTVNVALRFALVYGFTSALIADAVDDITAALTEGALTPLPETRFGLDQVAAAHDAVRSGVTGKVLIDLP
jgi:NADPH:quinone reductase-like Zn-dependent oxidoreductase